MKVGIFSGSFNPVHGGHLGLARWVLRQQYVDEIWFIRSPRNPLKVHQYLLDDRHRLRMLQLAIARESKMKICHIEDELPKPSYTIHTLEALSRRYPADEFYLIVGADNWQIFTKWYRWEDIVNRFHLLVYPRSGDELLSVDKSRFPHVSVIDAPLFPIPATQIREAIGRGDPELSSWLTPEVREYIEQNHLYR